MKREEEEKWQGGKCEECGFEASSDSTTILYGELWNGTVNHRSVDGCLESLKSALEAAQGENKGLRLKIEEIAKEAGKQKTEAQEAKRMIEHLQHENERLERQFDAATNELIKWNREDREKEALSRTEKEGGG